MSSILQYTRKMSFSPEPLITRSPYVKLRAQMYILDHGHLQGRFTLASVFRVDGQSLLDLIGEDEKLQYHRKSHPVRCSVSPYIFKEPFRCLVKDNVFPEILLAYLSLFYNIYLHRFYEQNKDVIRSIAKGNHADSSTIDSYNGPPKKSSAGTPKACSALFSLRCAKRRYPCAS